MNTFEYAVIDWQNSHPYAKNFSDVYFSTDPSLSSQGIAETDYVFLQHNFLKSRWQAIIPNSNAHFTIVELGFGSGLNFLASVDLWLKTAPLTTRLNYIAYEKHPFRRDDLVRAHQNWPQFSSLSGSLLSQYHSLHEGYTHFTLCQQRVQLTLIIGDIATWLPQLNSQVDAWYLDGFAPAKNPAMWQVDLFKHMVKQSNLGATFATFTSAGEVRRGLVSAGFQVQKTSGYGKKREMLFGSIGAPSAMPIQPRQAHIVVIGAGIAGCSSAYHLAQLGFKVTVLEQAECIANGASGNALAVIYPRLSGQQNSLEIFNWHGLAFCLREYAQLAPQTLSVCGVLELAFNAREFRRLRKVWQTYQHTDNLDWLEAEQASQQAQVNIQTPALYFKHCAYVAPKLLCEAYLAKASCVSIRLGHKLQALAQTDKGWHMMCENGAQLDADVVVVANAYQAINLTQLMHLPLQAVRGQMTLIKAHTESQKLRTVLCGDGYMTPAITALENAHAIGATFQPENADIHVCHQDNKRNLEMASQLATDFKTGWNEDAIMAGRASVRCASHDYLPLVGCIVDAIHLQQTLPKHSNQSYTVPHYQGLYANLAHGSKGLSTAPFCSAMLARHIANDLGQGLPFLCHHALWQSLNPNRQFYKKLGLKRLLTQ